MDTQFYVGNLPLRTNEDALRAAFSRFGDVLEVNIVTDPQTGESRGFAFVRMGSEQAVRDAISAMDGVAFDGRSLRVESAEPRHPRSVRNAAEAAAGRYADSSRYLR